MLLEVEVQLPYLVANLPAIKHYNLPHIRLTAASRKLARQLLGEVREKKSGKVLARATWQLLVHLWKQDSDVVRQQWPAYCSSEVFMRL